MDRIIVSMIVCFIASGALAQNKADIIVSFDENCMNWERDTLQTTQMSLLANTREAKYFNDLSLWTDSLKSTPEGKDQLRQIIMASCMTQSPDGGISFDMTKGPVKTVDTYVFTNVGNGSLRYYSKFGEEQGYYDEPLTEMAWQIGDSVKNILGYEQGNRIKIHSF